MLVQVSGEMSRADLLAATKAKHRAAGNKVSRLKANDIVKIAGTEHDPRRDMRKIEKYNKTQLTNYFNKLDKFTDRKTKFIGDAHGRVLDPEKWALYKEREKAVKHLEEKEFNRIANIRLPNPGTSEKSKKTQTLEKRNKDMLASRRGGKDRTVNSRFNAPVRKPHQIASAASLDVMSKAIGKRLSGDYKNVELTEQRRIMNAMLDVLNEPELVTKLAGLTDKQFDIMWNHTDMPDDLKPKYLLAMKRLQAESDAATHKDDKREAITNEEDSQNTLRVHNWMDWAGAINTDDKANAKKKKKPRAKKKKR